MNREIYKNLAISFVEKNEDRLRDLIIEEMDYSRLQDVVQNRVYDLLDLRKQMRKLGNELMDDIANAIADEVVDMIELELEDFDPFGGTSQFLPDIASYLEFE